MVIESLRISKGYKATQVLISLFVFNQKHQVICIRLAVLGRGTLLPITRSDVYLTS